MIQDLKNLLETDMKTKKTAAKKSNAKASPAKSGKKPRQSRR